MAGGHARLSRASATSKKPVYASHSDDSSDEDFAEASNQINDNEKKKGKNSKATGKRKDPPPRITLSPATKAPPPNEQKDKDEEQGDSELKMSAVIPSRKKRKPSTYTSTTTKSKNKVTKGINPLYVYYDLEATGIETNDVFLEEVKIFQIGARSSRLSSKDFSGRSSMFVCAMCNNIITCIILIYIVFIFIT